MMHSSHKTAHAYNKGYGIKIAINLFRSVSRAGTVNTKVLLLTQTSLKNIDYVEEL